MPAVSWLIATRWGLPHVSRTKGSSAERLPVRSYTVGWQKGETGGEGMKEVEGGGEQRTV
jgi:hypothetical protein